MILNRNKEEKGMSWLVYPMIFCIIGVAIYGGKERIKKELHNFITIDKAEIQQLIKEYIEQNPRVILASVENMQKKEYEEMAKKAKTAINDKKNELQGKEGEINLVAGNKDGDVVITTFLDYNCGYCKSSNRSIKELITKDPNVKVVFKELPVLGPPSQKLAKMALAVYLLDKEKYMEFHNILMDGPAISDEKLADILKKLNIDNKKLDELMNDPRIQKELEEVASLSSQLGIRGTPAFIIGDELIPGAIDLNSMLEKVKLIRANGNKNAENK